MEKLLQLKKAVKDAVAPDPLGAFRLSETGRPAGHQRLFKAFDATDKSTGENVTAFICSFAAVEERCGGQREEVEYTLRKLREGVQMLTKLRHPHVLRIVMPVTEDKARHRFVFVSERVDRWIVNEVDRYGGSATRAEGCTMSKVEVLFGLHQLGVTMDFLHTKAGIMLLQFSPASIVITQSGDWKLGDMTHAVSAAAITESASGALKVLSVVPNRSSSLFQSVGAPLLDYCAPEVVDGLEKLSREGITTNNGGGSPKTAPVPDLFSDFHSSTTSRQRGEGPAFPDSDVYSFVLTTVAVSEERKLVNSGGEVSVYRRQQVDANEACRRLFPQWGNNPLKELPRVPLAHILQTECFAAREVKLLSELPELLSMEPKAKLTLLKGFHDEIARGAFDGVVLQRWVIPALLQQTEDERMIKYIVPILLEAAAAMSTSIFDQSLRNYLSAIIQRAVASSRREAASDPIGDILLAQLLDKFLRFWTKFSAVKDIQQLLGPLLCAGLVSVNKTVVKEALIALHALLDAVERPFACCDSVARDVLAGVITCPEEASLVIQCLRALLPNTTREGRESELEPKLVAGLHQLCTSSSVAADDVEQLLKVLVSIVSESSVDHVATKTLPLLCPLLILHHVVVRQHISAYVNQLVQMVISKKQVEDEEEQRKRDQSQTFDRAPTVADLAAKKAPSMAVASRSSDESSTSFFSEVRPRITEPIAGPSPKIVAVSPNAEYNRGAVARSPALSASGKSLSSGYGTQPQQRPRDDVRDAFGF